jgi:hypothetical protein
MYQVGRTVLRDVRDMFDKELITKLLKAASEQ